MRKIVQLVDILVCFGWIQIILGMKKEEDDDDDNDDNSNSNSKYCTAAYGLQAFYVNPTLTGHWKFMQVG